METIQERIKTLLNNGKELDVRITKNGRWVDQKCTPDIISTIAEIIVNYFEKNNTTKFYSTDLWKFNYSNEIIKDFFGKPDLFKSESANEYDKYFQQPVKLFAAAGIFTEMKENNKILFTLNKNYRFLLDYISYDVKKSIEFLNIYFEAVLKKSDLWSSFEYFFQKQNKESTFKLKTDFINFYHKNTNITKDYEPRRILPKIVNVLAFKRKLHGFQRGEISDDIIQFNDLLYNRKNWRDLKKDKNQTRKEYLDSISENKDTEFYKINSSKAKRIYREHNRIENKGLSELFFMQGELSPSVQIHHIFPESDFPEIASFLENLIALTPTEHLSLAHPNNNTKYTDPKYQKLFLKIKTESIKSDYNLNKFFFSKENFIDMLNIGFETTLFVKEMNFEEIKNMIDNYLK